MSADFVQPLTPHPGPPRSRNRLWALLLGILVALPASAWFWGFTVDDALITARVAAHFAQGLGPRFNAQGLVTDAVTPLGYAQFLALFGGGDVLETFAAARFLGLLAWLASAGLLGRLMDRSGQRRQRFTPLAVVAISAPLAAWASSGMETGVLTLLATLGLLGGGTGALALGVAAALRPELMPFAWLLVAGRVTVERPHWTRGARECGLAVSPVLVTGLMRWACFGSVVPLAFYAKPSDFGHGLRYALGAFAFTGLPWLLLGTPRELSRLPRAALPLFLALAGHAGALILCGGDWMALYRLAVPVLPCAALAAAYLADQAHPALAIARLVLALSGALLLAVGLGPQARRVGADRARLISAARSVFDRDLRIACLDVGWVGAASDAQVIDLAGVTDPQVAFMPGGHSSKRIPRAWLFARHPTAIVLLLAHGAALETPYEESIFARQVEQRVARLVAAEFRVRTTLRLVEQTYLVLEPNLERSTVPAPR
jgi:hypothetical protein